MKKFRKRKSFWFGGNKSGLGVQIFNLSTNQKETVAQGGGGGLGTLKWGEIGMGVSFQQISAEKQKRGRHELEVQMSADMRQRYTQRIGQGNLPKESNYKT